MADVTIQRETKHYPQANEYGGFDVKVVTCEYENGQRTSRKIHRGVLNNESKDYDTKFQELMDKFVPQLQQDQLDIIVQKDNALLQKDLEVQAHVAEKASLKSERIGLIELRDNLSMQIQEEQASGKLKDKKIAELEAKILTLK